MALLLLTKESLAEIDRRGYRVIEAISPGGAISVNTASHPATFIAIDGITYWVKGTTQQGLVAELIAGRLGAKLGVAPACRIIRVVPAILSLAGAPADLEGVVCGNEDMPDTVNARDLEPFIAGGNFEPSLIDGAARARVVTFQTWLGLGDSQVLVRLTDGAVLSIDHGDCFGAMSAAATPIPIVTPIPHVADSVGKNLSFVKSAVSGVERIGNRDLLDAVAAIPSGDPWKSPVERRHEIACWLEARRDQLRGVMEAWAQT